MSMAATTPRIIVPPPFATMEDSSHMQTPTRDSFGGMHGQRPLPSAPGLGEVARSATSYIGRSDSGHSSKTGESYDVDMEDARPDQASDNESETGDPNKSASKKKKSQRFFCTDFPPCQLSFTRSEHLARHIRKHTGERPFACHCGKRFTRLDNLRQHAQTVHVNEDIPPESLAATGTRFQRQIRTDRIRPSNGRSRGSISGSGGHARGHSRNWSESSIGSVSDIASPIDDGRRYAPSYPMTQMSPNRASGLTLDTHFAGQPDPYRSSYDSPGGYMAPASAFSYATSSPSTLTSPGSMIPRNAPWNGRGDPAARRLTFAAPSADPQMPPGYPAQMLSSGPGPGPGPALLTPTASSAASSYSQSGSGFASPTSSVFSDYPRNAPSDADIRRRTWHPGTPGTYYGSRPPTSGLSYYSTPDGEGPVNTAQPAATQAIRLPGFEAFDRASRGHGGMVGDVNAYRVSSYETLNRPAEVNRGGQRDSWGSISHGLTQLDISRAQDNSPQSGMPRPTTSSGLPPQPSFQVPALPVQAPPRQAPPSSYHAQPKTHVVDVARGQIAEHPRPHTIDNPLTPRNVKRLGWYQGPPSVAMDPPPVPSRTSPVGSSSSGEGLITPSTAFVAEPIIVQPNEYNEQQRPDLPVEDMQKSQMMSHNGYPLPPPEVSEHRPHPTVVQSSPRQPQPSDMQRLDALVAVATSEKQVGTQ